MYDDKIKFKTRVRGIEIIWKLNYKTDKLTIMKIN
jgi:hypothetical protein